MTPEQVTQAKKLLIWGVTRRDVARLFGIHEQTLLKYTHDTVIHPKNKRYKRTNTRRWGHLNP